MCNARQLKKHVKLLPKLGRVIIPHQKSAVDLPEVCELHALP